MGTAFYAAPELILKKYDEKSDVWALGITLLEMLTQQKLFSGDGI